MEFDEHIFFQILRHCDVFSAYSISSTCATSRRALKCLQETNLDLVDEKVPNVSLCNRWLNDIEQEAMREFNQRLVEYSLSSLEIGADEKSFVIVKLLANSNVSQKIYDHFSNVVFHDRIHLVTFNLYDWIRDKISHAIAFYDY